MAATLLQKDQGLQNPSKNFANWLGVLGLLLSRNDVFESFGRYI